MAATQVDVAARVGVSRALVSLVMRGSDQVAPDTRAAVLRAAEELGYQPNAFAARLASRTSRTLGVVLVQLDNPVFPETMRGIEEAATVAHYGMLLKTGAELSPADERVAISDHLAHRVDALILVATRLADEEIQALARRVPVVTVYRHVAAVDGVATDESQAASLVVEHLISIGHERIAHVDAGSNPGALARREAYESVMRSHGLGSNIRVEHGDYTEPGGRAAAHRLLAHDRPTAIFAANDLSALGVMGAALERGLVVPRDVSVAGIDNIALSAYPYISLTTAEQPMAKMGQEAIRLATERIGTALPARHIVAPTKLITRSSTQSAPPKPQAIA